jgi:hypothetical protein
MRIHIEFYSSNLVPTVFDQILAPGYQISAKPRALGVHAPRNDMPSEDFYYNQGHTLCLRPLSHMDFSTHSQAELEVEAGGRLPKRRYDLLADHAERAISLVSIRPLISTDARLHINRRRASQRTSGRRPSHRRMASTAGRAWPVADGAQRSPTESAQSRYDRIRQPDGPPTAPRTC